jgi:uroporphyrinogen decarboxylase
MTPRERVRTTLLHQEPDRIPIDFGSRSSAFEEQPYRELQAHLKLEEEIRPFLRAHAVMSEEVLDFLQVDTRWIRSIPASSWFSDDEGDVYLDRWNVPWRRKRGRLYYELEPSPLVTMQREDIERLEIPELISDAMLDDMRVQAEGYDRDTDYSLWCDVVGAGIFERAWYLRGFEQFIMEMMVEKRFAHAFFEKILETQISAYRKLLEAIGTHIEGVLITDDVAMQDSLVMSPETYREMLKPYQKRLIESIQAYGVSVLWHSCGAIYPLIPDFIDMGVRILHPVQTSAQDMDPQRLKQQFGRDIVLWGGGCDIQTVLQTATSAEVTEEIQRKISKLAPGGGFVFTTTHCIQPDTPLENILAMVQAYKRFGYYPQLGNTQSDKTGVMQ